MAEPADAAPAMEKFAFTMRLRPGQEAQYRRRHDAIQSDLLALLREVGVSDYSIHLDRATNVLFGVLWRRKDHRMDDLPSHPLMRQWWAQMADIMETHASDEPIVTPLVTMFHMM